MSEPESPDPSHPPRREPYAPPRLLRVQARTQGDNLSSGCKNVSISGPLSADCGIGIGPACTDTTGS